MVKLKDTEAAEVHRVGETREVGVEEGLTELLAKLEMPLLPVLCRMERAGVRVEATVLKLMETQLMVLIDLPWRKYIRDQVSVYVWMHQLQLRNSLRRLPLT